MTSKLLETHKQKITGMTLIPSKGGCFELSVGNELIFSKLKDGKFPDEKWAVDAVGQRLK